MFAQVVTCLLQLSPSRRPTADKILESSIVQRHLKTDAPPERSRHKEHMLFKTIKVGPCSVHRACYKILCLLQVWAGHALSLQSVCLVSPAYLYAGGHREHKALSFPSHVQCRCPEHWNWTSGVCCPRPHTKRRQRPVRPTSTGRDQHSGQMCHLAWRPPKALSHQHKPSGV